MPTQPTVAPYGTWTSPISAASLTTSGVTLVEPAADGTDVYWLEARPAKAGRVVLVRRTADGRVQDVTPDPFNARTRVHEYGGGSYAVDRGRIVFANFADQRLYRVDIEPDTGAPGEPRPITPPEQLRFGGLVIDPRRDQVYAVREDHRAGGEPQNTLVRLALDGPNEGGGVLVAAGADFFSRPSLDPAGRRLAWVRWQHPNMPWDHTELWVADLDDVGDPIGPRRVAAGLEGSITEPVWAPDGRLLLLSDDTGWANLYSLDLPTPMGAADPDPVPLAPLEFEFGQPQWGLGMSSYCVTSAGIVCMWVADGLHRLGLLDEQGLHPISGDPTSITNVRPYGDGIVCLTGSAAEPMAVVRVDPAGSGWQVLASATAEAPDHRWVSRPQPVSWTNTDGLTAHGLYYPPTNPDFVAPADDRPPLLVESHGGPTAMFVAAFTPSTQYWTSRGFAVLDVNYGGSTGYGRAYRERLRGSWGIVDVQDCVTGAQAMADRGLADRDRLAIRGGSAGGFTTLAALAFTDVFAAGASHYGVSDLAALATDTHKFESRYLDGLVGPYPQAREVYAERSPIRHTDRLSVPLILLQGADDLVVPPSQAQLMADAVRAKGLPVAVLMFDGEGHGFRRGENIIRAVEAEAWFYAHVFGFELADDVPPVPLDG